MTDLLWGATLKGAPRTKKNHQRILHDFGGRPFVDPSKGFTEYERSCLAQIKTPYRPVSAAVNATCLYYMPAAARRQAGEPGSPSGKEAKRCLKELWRISYAKRWRGRGACA